MKKKKKTALKGKIYLQKTHRQHAQSQCLFFVRNGHTKQISSDKQMPKHCRDSSPDKICLGAEIMLVCMHTPEEVQLDQNAVH